MSTIKARAGATGAEQVAYLDRAKALGLELRDGAIAPASAKNIRGGEAALRAQLNGDVLDQPGLEKLRRGGLLAPLVGADLPISQQKSRDVRALAMELGGAALAIERAQTTMTQSERLTNSTLLGPMEKLAEVTERFNAVVGHEPGSLAQVDGDSARALAEGIGRLATTMAGYTSTLSSFREAVASAEPQGLWSSMQFNAILKNLQASIDGNRQIQLLADVFGTPAPGAQGVGRRVLELGRELDARLGTGNG
jgi:hypothetical protein